VKCDYHIKLLILHNLLFKARQLSLQLLMNMSPANGVIYQNVLHPTKLCFWHYI